jgi:hypothetical protein
MTRTSAAGVLIQKADWATGASRACCAFSYLTEHFLGIHSNLATLGHFLLIARPRVFDCL